MSRPLGEVNPMMDVIYIQRPEMVIEEYSMTIVVTLNYV